MPRAKRIVTSLACRVKRRKEEERIGALRKRLMYQISEERSEISRSVKECCAPILLDIARRYLGTSEISLSLSLSLSENKI